ncbi:glycosyltransferase family 29 protein [Capnocytophaga cynodegmi]|uniref:glycosyltransferase family 29 protein n=1 Tax=Capnocytophaga cynodegmi TaxID=28189 RepID=UPI001AD5C0E9|nr:glycosyltransferase family 29 protein [Capnocytophaga cynodegmi]GIM55029.1 hypothetical protein CAPN005_16760 [Capnocytophaga cynodegmi]
MKIIKRVIGRLKFEINSILIPILYGKILYSFDEKWFRGKRVAIVGGADSVLNEKLGDYIDGFDIVVRINKGVEVIETQHQYVGKRTDVLFHSLYVRENDKGSSPFTTDLWKKNNVGKIIFAHNYKVNSYAMFNLLDFIKSTKKKIRLSQVQKNVYVSCIKALTQGPTTGFMAINSVFYCQPRELYITGITFFKTPHNSCYRDIQNSYIETVQHNIEEEYNYVKQLYNKNKSVIIPDKMLRQIFETN